MRNYAARLIVCLWTCAWVCAPTRVYAAPIDWKAAVALAVGQSADAVTTVRALHTGRCNEGNSAIYGAQPSAGRVIATKAAITGGVLLAMHLIASKARTPRAATVMGWIVGAAGGGAAMWNLSQCR